MDFRPCIDIHNGTVKQIVGGSLRDDSDSALENFVSRQDAVFYAEFYKKYHIRGGHIIMLNSISSDFYMATKQQAVAALSAYPGGLQAGGGITAENACDYLDAGASHIIITSYVFSEGSIKYENLQKLNREIGKNKIVLDLSCRKKDGFYYIVTDRWQKYTEVELNAAILDELASYCDEFLIHAVDVEGRAQGIEEQIVSLLGEWGKIPVTYAGGVHNFSELEKLNDLGKGKVDVTIGSALDLFGGSMKWEEVISYFKQKRTYPM